MKKKKEYSLHMVTPGGTVRLAGRAKDIDAAVDWAKATADKTRMTIEVHHGGAWCRTFEPAMFGPPQ
jgi:hypothetical protein